MLQLAISSKREESNHFVINFFTVPIIEAIHYPKKLAHIFGQTHIVFSFISGSFARNATTTFAYNNRNLVTGITYGVPTGVAATANVSFGYDAAGNRTSMTDGLGSVTYNYNQLSQLTSEARTFSGVSGTFDLTYAYNLAGELTSITNEWGAQVGYSYDKTATTLNIVESIYRVN